MRVAIVHSFYREALPSGENQIVREQVELLSEAGHDVCLVARRSDDEIVKRGYGLRASLRVATGWGNDPVEDLRRFRPDITHIHNLFPNFGTRWLKEWPGPIVATMHNFRTLCSNGVLFRNGNICLDCLKGSPWPGVRNRCYRQSVTATVPVALSISRSGHANALLERANAILCLSDQAAQIFELSGLPRESLYVLPNPLRDPQPKLIREGNGWLYSGRLTDEKGILQLVKQWPEQAEHLDVVGDGPLLSQIESNCPSNVRVVGSLSRGELLGRIPRYRGLLIPTRLMEVQPTVVAEALACGVPVVAFASNAGAATVRNWEVGSVYSSEIDLPSALNQGVAEGEDLRRHSRRMYEQHLDVAKWENRLVEIYDSLT